MLIIGPVEKFKDHSQFKDINDFNKQMEMFQAVHKKAFTKTEYMLFKRLLRFASKVPGVATASIKTILKWTKAKDFVLGASESSFQRMKRKAIKLGILEVKQTERTNSSTSSNLWIFKRFVSNSTTIDTPPVPGRQVEPAPAKGKVFNQLTPLKTSNITKTSNLSTKRIETAATKKLKVNSSLDHTFTSDRVPKAFVMTVKPFFDDSRIIEEYWNMVKISSYDYRDSIASEAVLSLAMQSFKQMIGRFKKGTVEKPIGYFTGVLQRKLGALAEEIIAADSTEGREDTYTSIPDVFMAMLGIKKDPLSVTD